MAYPAGYWAELVRSSSFSSLLPSVTGGNIWLRTSDGEPLEQEIFFNGRWQAQVDDDEPDYVNQISSNNPWRARKSGEDWIPSSSGIRLDTIPWAAGSAVYRFYENPILPSFGSSDTATSQVWSINEQITTLNIPYPDANGRPSRDVSYATIGALPAGIRLDTYQETVGSGNEQTINNFPSLFDYAWATASINFPVINALKPNPASNIYLTRVSVSATGSVTISFNEVRSNIDRPNIDLSDTFEQNGSMTIIVGNLSLTVSLMGMDTSDPYNFIPNNSAEVITFYNNLVGNSGNATIILRDYTPYQRTRARIVSPAGAGGRAGPTEVGSGNIIIRASNTDGSDDYTIPYVIRGNFGAWGGMELEGAAWGTQEIVGAAWGDTELF